MEIHLNKSIYPVTLVKESHHEWSQFSISIDENNTHITIKGDEPVLLEFVNYVLAKL